MPDLSSLVDIAELAQAMGKQSVYVRTERCLPVRHRKSRCTACVDVCPAEAIIVGGNKLLLNKEACIGCGACSTVCPSEALIALDPPDSKVQADCGILMNESESLGLRPGEVCIACARKASRQQADDQSFLEVSCLCRIHEKTLISLVAEGATTINLIDGGCDTCKLKKCAQVIETVAENAQKLLDFQGSSAKVVRRSDFPSGMPEYARRELRDSRREFFSTSASTSKETLTKTVRFFIKKEASKDSTVATVADAFGLTQEEEVRKVIEARRHVDLIDALYEVGEPTQETLDCRFFGSIEIDALKCSLCGICAVVCPTKALQRSKRPANPGESTRPFLDFWASDCSQCHMCEDVCFKDCLKVTSQVSADALFSFDPQAVVSVGN